MSNIDALLTHSVDPAGLRPDPGNPNYTSPRTWGVYEIVRKGSAGTGKRFRKGNHPIRQKELQNEFGAVNLVALFMDESIAIALKAELNR